MKVLKLKEVLTVAYLLATFFVTAATSKAGPHSPTQDRITNYQVYSNCPGAIEDSRIRVNNSTIVEGTFPAEYYSDGSDGEEGHRSFESFGFNYGFIFVGQDDIGQYEAKGRECKVRDQSTILNNSYDPNETDYWFANPGYYTDTIYDCYDYEQFSCSITFEELRPVDFEQLRNF